MEKIIKKAFILNNTLLNNQWIKEEIKWKIKKYLEANEIEITTHPKVWDTAKAALSQAFIMINTYIKRQKTRKNSKKQSKITS